MEKLKEKVYNYLSSYTKSKIKWDCLKEIGSTYRTRGFMLQLADEFPHIDFTTLKIKKHEFEILENLKKLNHLTRAEQAKELNLRLHKLHGLVVMFGCMNLLELKPKGNIIAKDIADPWERELLNSMGYKKTVVYGTKPKNGNKPYKVTHIRVNGKTKTLLVHRLIWEHFNGPIPKGWDIHHLDEDKHNNRIENLSILKHGEHTSISKKGVKQGRIYNWSA